MTGQGAAGGFWFGLCRGFGRDGEGSGWGGRLFDFAGFAPGAAFDGALEFLDEEPAAGGGDAEDGSGDDPSGGDAGSEEETERESQTQDPEEEGGGKGDE